MLVTSGSFLGLLIVTPLLRDWLARKALNRGLQRVKRQLDLEYYETIAWEELEPFRRFVLFRFGSDGSYAAGHSLRGRVSEFDAWFFVVEYTCAFPNRDGRYLGHRASQSVVILAVGGKRPSFRLGPAQSKWEQVMPAWPALLDVGEMVLSGGEKHQPWHLHGKVRKTLSHLFRPDRMGLLGDLSGWVVESQGGHLLLYRPGEVIAPDRVPDFLHRAIEIARVLTCPDEEIPTREDDRDVTQSRNVRMPPPRFHEET
jgi:hypothetical protein